MVIIIALSYLPKLSNYKVTRIVKLKTFTQYLGQNLVTEYFCRRAHTSKWGQNTGSYKTLIISVFVWEETQGTKFGFCWNFQFLEIMWGHSERAIKTRQNYSRIISWVMLDLQCWSNLFFINTLIQLNILTRQNFTLWRLYKIESQLSRTGLVG